MEALFVVVSAAGQYPHITAVLLYDVRPKLHICALNIFNAYACKVLHSGNHAKIMFPIGEFQTVQKLGV